MKNAINTFLLVSFLPCWLFSQTYKDCETALNICNKDSLSFAFTDFSVGNDPDELNATCLQSEFSSTWIKWEIAGAGKLVFTIIPADSLDDLDFVVFKLSTNGDCASKTPARCEAAGEDVGSPFPAWEICMGATGLDFAETDTVEYPGCGNGNNNFLAPLDCQPGEVYALAINNFTSSGGGFAITFGGDAELVCDPLSALAGVDNSRINAFPNPVAGGKLGLSAEGFENQTGLWIVYDARGKEVGRAPFLPSGESRNFDVKNWPSGVYIAVLQTGQGLFSTKIVRL